VLVFSPVHHVVVTTKIPVKSGWTTGGEYSEEGSIRARERCGRVLSMGTYFFSLWLCMKMHETEGKQTLCNSIPELLFFKFNPIMVLHSKFDIPL
jgi:hypothetical protein